jgi:DNA-binding transcriptional LysR family regulator
VAAISTEDVLAMLTFSRVVEEKSFTKAATKLGVAKSVVSSRISALERTLGTRLLHRTTRKLSLTAEGGELYERCARVVVAAEEAAAAVSGVGSEPHGVLRLNAPIVFAEEYLAAPLTQYLERYPAVRVDLGLSDRVVDLHDEGIDVAIRISARLSGTGLTARKLATDYPVLCASPSYLARKGRPRTAEELREHDCLVYSLLRVADEWSFQERGERQPRPAAIRPRFSAGSGAVLRRAALAGMGLAVLPRFMVANDLAAGRLEGVLDSLHAPELGIYAVYPQVHRVPSKVRALLDLLVLHFKTRRW